MADKFPRAPERTTPGFGFSMVERAILEGLARREFGQTEMLEILAHLGFNQPECVFCGSTLVGRWDHLVPVKKGGDTVKGNMVPACARCDDSKRDEDFETWMKSTAKNSPRSLGVPDVEERVARLRAYASAFDYKARRGDEDLLPDEADELAQLRERLKELRSAIESFLERVNSRRDAAIQ